MIWVVLCGFDQQYCTAKQREAAKSGKGRSHTSSGTGYGGTNRLARLGDYDSGVGYGGDEDHFGFPFGRRGGSLQARQDPGKAKAQSAQQVTDEFHKTMLAYLEELLPSLDRESRFDLDPPEAVTDLLLDSKILNYCAELLRNDSLDDASKRKDLYQALLNFLRIIGTHHITANLTMFKERPVHPDSVNILTLSFARNDHGPGKETTISLADGLRNLNIQSNIMLKNAARNEQEFKTNEGQDLLWLCRQISDLSEWLLKNTKGGCGSGAKSSSNGPNDRGIIEVRDSDIFATHRFAGEAMGVRHSAPGRIKRLITEITTLKTGLPPGIFVKYAESRLDMMKFVIVGPSGTPYENGLFEFDLFCTAEFPNRSPKCFFRGAAGGMPFNPNLHSDGKGKFCIRALISQELTKIQSVSLC